MHPAVFQNFTQNKAGFVNYCFSDNYKDAKKV